MKLRPRYALVPLLAVLGILLALFLFVRQAQVREARPAIPPQLVLPPDPLPAPAR